MISKELLSEVFNRKVRTFTIIDNIAYYQYREIYYGGISGIDDEEINIYELAHKCKEWAYNQGYVLDCFSKCTEIRKKNEEDILYIERGELFDDSSYDISLVFKACQWILDNKEG